MFNGDFPTLPVGQPFTYDGPVGSGGREAAFLVRASVCGSRVLQIPPVSVGVCSTKLGASAHITVSMEGCHRSPVSVLGEILSPLPSVCRMHSAFQWSSPPTCGILIPTFLVLVRAMCQSPRPWTCWWPLADQSCAISQIGRPTPRALDWIACPSPLVTLWTLWCVMDCVVALYPESHHFLCIVTGLSHPTRQHPMRGPTLPPLSDWRPTLVRAHAELRQWSARVQDLCQSCPRSRASLDGVFNEMISILQRHALRQPSW